MNQKILFSILALATIALLSLPIYSVYKIATNQASQAEWDMNRANAISIQNKKCENLRKEAERPDTIISLGKDSVLQGSSNTSGKLGGAFFLGIGGLGGSINSNGELSEQRQYFFYKEVGPAQYKLQTSPADTTTIHEDQRNKAFIIQNHTSKVNEVSWPDGSTSYACEISHTGTEIHLPTGNIIRQFSP